MIWHCEFGPQGDGVHDGGRSVAGSIGTEHFQNSHVIQSKFTDLFMYRTKSGFRYVTHTYIIVTTLMLEVIGIIPLNQIRSIQY